MALGIQILHATKRNELHVVENGKRPYGDGGYMCNLCPNTKHRFKATHLWLGPNGDCLVSTGVLEELQQTSMVDLTVIGYTRKPPPLRIGKKEETRDVQENEHRKIHVFAKIPEVDKAKAEAG